MNARFVHAAYPQIVAHNRFEIAGDIVQMELTQGEYAVFNLVDLPLLAPHRWCAAWFRRNIYAITQVRNEQGRQESVRMHRLITDVIDPAVFVDHHDLDGLNNHRENLRIATRPQNGWNCSRPLRNTSGYKGVKRDAKSGRYSAQIKVHGKTLYLGRHDTPVEAARAYDEAARLYHGEFARTNF